MVKPSKVGEQAVQKPQSSNVSIADILRKFQETVPMAGASENHGRKIRTPRSGRRAGDAITDGVMSSTLPGGTLGCVVQFRY